MNLRDHDLPCEHGSRATHSWNYPEYGSCPGGRKVEVHKIGWCPRAGGHADTPEPDDPTYGECGSKWEYEAWMTDWRPVVSDGE